MKKSNTTMKVPARSTGSGSQRLREWVKAAGAGPTAVIDSVLMTATVPPGGHRVDYPPGNGAARFEELFGYPYGVLTYARHSSSRAEASAPLQVIAPKQRSL